MNAEERDNILISVKKYCGIDDGTDEDSAYTDQIITHINSVFMMLNQMGVGPDKGFRVVDGTETWSSYKGDSGNDFNGVEDYVKMKTRLLFDPGSLTPNMKTSTEELLKEIEWRLNYKADAITNGLIS